ITIGASVIRMVVALFAACAFYFSTYPAKGPFWAGILIALLAILAAETAAIRAFLISTYAPRPTPGAPMEPRLASPRPSPPPPPHPGRPHGAPRRMTPLLTTLAASNPVDHVVNQHFHTVRLFGMDVWLWSAHVGNLIVAGFLTVGLLWWAASRIRTGPESEGHDRYVTRSPLAHAIEVVCVYLRDTTVRPLLGERTDRFMPFL